MSTDTDTDTASTDPPTDEQTTITTASNVATSIAEAADDRTLARYDGEMRGAILSAIETLVQADGAARLAAVGSDDPETDARRRLLADLLETPGFSPGRSLSESDIVDRLAENLDDARPLAEWDSDASGPAAQLAAPRLCEFVLAVPSRSPYYGARSKGPVSDRLDGSGDRLLGEALRYVYESGGQRSGDEDDPCPFFGPTEETIADRREARAEERAELESRIQEHYKELAEHIDGFSEAAHDLHQYALANGKRSDVPGTQKKLSAPHRRAQELNQLDDRLLLALQDSCTDLDDAIAKRADD
jgi:hypothetical protein